MVRTRPPPSRRIRKRANEHHGETAASHGSADNQPIVIVSEIPAPLISCGSQNAMPKADQQKKIGEAARTVSGFLSASL